MFEVVFLGTAAGVPTVERGLPALLVRHGRRRFLVDCGEGTQRQLMRSGLGFRHLEAVLLTHGHLDHLLGLGGLAGTLALLDAADRLKVYGAAPVLRAVHALLAEVVWPNGAPPLAVETRTLGAGPVIEQPELTVRAFPVSHRESTSFGFAFEERPRRRMLPARLAALGVPRGPERQRLLAGRTVALPGGRTVHPDEVLAPAEPGTRLVVIGDAGGTDDLLEHACAADALIIEATYLERDAAKAAARGHLTAAKAAALARAAGVGALHLTHVSPRYPEAEIAAEARAVFAATTVARDLERVQVRRRRR